jgi:hypothetical protein
MIDKLEAARRQLDCAIRLTAALDDELAVHTLVMASFGVLNDLAKETTNYNVKFKPYFTEIGWRQLTTTANFLKHANHDPDAILTPLDPRETYFRIGFCVLLYRSIKGMITPLMAAFHCWMIIRYPDEFQIAEDADEAFERAYRDSIVFMKEEGHQVETILLNALIKTYQGGNNLSRCWISSSLTSAMDKQHILSEIKRTAAANGGVPLGRERFFRETGIKYHEWIGKIWARWGDALREAGFEPNKLQTAYNDDILI